MLLLWRHRTNNVKEPSSPEGWIRLNKRAAVRIGYILVDCCQNCCHSNEEQVMRDEEEKFHCGYFCLVTDRNGKCKKWRKA